MEKHERLLTTLSMFANVQLVNIQSFHYQPFYCGHYITDLKAFERRLTEYVSCLQPATGRWRSKYLTFNALFSLNVLSSNLILKITIDCTNVLAIDSRHLGYINVGNMSYH